MILDAGSRTGETWRDRYDSLTLFTPRAYSQLPGLDLQGDPRGYPTKDEVAAYLETYQGAFGLPIQHSQTVRRLAPTPRGFVVETDRELLDARAVVVATGPFQIPKTPAWASDVAVPQVHSARYRGPTIVAGARVLVVGGGNSGAQIAEELAADGRRVTWAVSGTPRFVPALVLHRSVFWWLDTLGILSAHRESLRGRLLRRRGDPVFGGGMREMIDDGRVQQAHAAIGADGGTVSFEDGLTIEVDAVVWCTGFASDYGWLDVAGVLGTDGLPVHRDGISTADRRIGFVGLGWQRSRNSGLLGGVGADAAFVVEHLAGGRS